MARKSETFKTVKKSLLLQNIKTGSKAGGSELAENRKIMHRYFSTPPIFSAPVANIDREHGIIQGVTIAQDWTGQRSWWIYRSYFPASIG